MNFKELEQEVKRLEEQIINLKLKFAESKAENKPYEVEVPKDIRNYYYADEIGGIYVVGNIISIDAYKEIYQRGITFKTEEEVEQYDGERILLFKLHKWAEKYNGGWTPNWNDYKEEKWTVMYHNECKEFEIYENYRYREFLKLPYFKSEELAEQFIEEFGDEIKEVLC